MKVLMVTRKLDKSDWLAGFAYEWVQFLALELGKRNSKLKVISLEEGNSQGLLDNVEVSYVGKKNLSKFNRLKRFRKLLIKDKTEADVVLIHMHPLYAIIASLVGPRRPLVLWYTHKSVDLKLRLAEKLVDKIVSASSESFRLASKKVEFIGHGIPFLHFGRLSQRSSTFKILSVGRLSPIKRLDLLIESLSLFHKDHPQIRLEVNIAGGPGLPEQAFLLDDLKRQANLAGLSEVIKFLGPVPHSEIYEYYGKSDLFINLSETGSIDKAVLEAAASECLIITSNEAFKDIFPEAMVKPNPRLIADKIYEYYSLSPEEFKERGEGLRALVARNFGLQGFSQRLVTVLSKFEKV